MRSAYKMEEMTAAEFSEAVEKMPVFFVPTGLLEWHGDHLPLGLDTLKAYSICLETAEKLKGGIVLPPNYFGRPGFSRYPGTLTYSEACMDLLFTEMFGQLEKVGAKVIVLLTGHYGPCQYDFIKRVSDYYMKENPSSSVKIIAIAEYEDIMVEGEVPSDHAGKWETSLLWYLYPELAQMDKFVMQKRIKLYKNPPYDFYREEEDWKWEEDLRKSASQELGRKCVEAVCDNLIKKIRACL